MNGRLIELRNASLSVTTRPSSRGSKFAKRCSPPPVWNASPGDAEYSRRNARSRSAASGSPGDARSSPFTHAVSRSFGWTGSALSSAGFRPTSSPWSAAIASR